MAASLPQSAALSDDAGVAVLYLVPAATTSAELQTHMADFVLTYGDATGLRADFVATYRLRNPGDAPLTVPLRLIPDPNLAAPNLPDPLQVALALDGQPLLLQPESDGGFSTSITLAADSQATARLSLGDLTFGNGEAAAVLPVVRYRAQTLFGWPGRTSLRVSVGVPDVIVADSWLRTTPAGWTFSAANAQETMIKWLYEAAWPNEPFVFRFVHPTAWRELRSRELAAAPDASPATFGVLGDQYQELYGVALAQSLDDTGLRFYGEALAAYTAGLTRAQLLGADAATLASLHSGMARLYRSRMVDADGRVAPQYVQLMVQSAGAAMGLLPADGATYRELAQWRADGLRQLIVEARQRGDWSSVLNLLDVVSALPAELAAPDLLADERRIATVQQALQLLRQGNREAAVALAGPELVEAASAATQAVLPIMASWQITTTIDAAGMTLVLTALPSPQEPVRARALLDDQMALWRSTDLPADTELSIAETTVNGLSALRMTMHLPDREAALSLAQSLPPLPDWALLRTVLQQLDPDYADDSTFLRRAPRVSQQFDFTNVAAQWQDAAAKVDAQADRLEAQSVVTSRDDVAVVEAALQASVQAVNYRNAADLWQTLIDGSWVVTELSLPDGFGSSRRTWLATVTTPPQLYSYQSSSVNPNGLLAVIFAVLGVLLLLAFILWRLL